jgi:DNA gyrase/topoisomerase IV subunit B
LKKEYNRNNIVVLEGLEAVRKRFDMYMGSQQNLSFQMTKEIVDNAIDEFQKGYGTEVWVNLDTINNRISVIDNGRGFPQDMYNDKQSTMEVLLTTLHAGSNFDDDSEEQSAGRNGIDGPLI